MKRNSNFGYKGFAKINQQAKKNIEAMKSIPEKIDRNAIFNRVIEENPKTIIELANVLGAYSKKTAELLDSINSNIELVISYNKSDLGSIRNDVEQALGFFIPSKKQIYIRLDSTTLQALEKRGIELGVDVFESFRITFIHESIHAWFSLLPTYERLRVEDLLKDLASEILNAKIKTQYKYFKHYERMLADVKNESQTPQEVITYWFTNTDIQDALNSSNIHWISKIKSILHEILDSSPIENMIPIKKEVDMSEIIENLPSNIGNNMIGDEFFTQNPSKVLGKIVARTNQFGQMYNSVQGNIEEEIKKIEASIPEQINSDDIQTGNSSDIPVEVKIEDAIKNVEQEILIPKKAKRSEKSKEGASGDFVNEIISYRESTLRYNSNLTRIEIEAYLYVHKEQKFSLYFDENMYGLADFLNNTVEYSVISGDGKTKKITTPLLISDHGSDNYHYYAEFLSGDILSKQKTVEYNKDNIINNISQTHYDQVITALIAAKPDNKKFNDVVISNRPVLLCHTKDARNHKITALKNGFEFKEAVSLVHGFTYWLRNYYSALEYNGVTYLEIEKYIDNEDFYKANKDADSTEKKSMEAKNSEAYQRAKVAGDDSFSYFLAEMVLDSELEVIEKQWNERFNKYVYPNLNKIPVGFTHSAKFKEGFPLMFSDVQRNSVAFMMLKGSGLLAYDVGVGKTLSAIISISNAIDNGQCKRPLVVVPNQTYQKWISEITNTKLYDKDTKNEVNSYGAICHLGSVNEMFNLNTDLIKTKLRSYSKEDNQKFDEIMLSISDLGDILNKYVDKKGNSIYVNLSKIKPNDIIHSSNIRDIVSDIENVINQEVMSMLMSDENASGLLGRLADYMDAKEQNQLLKWANAKVNLLKDVIKFSKKYYEYLIFTLGELNPIPEKTVTICTYEGFARFGFSEQTSNMIFEELLAILSQGQQLTDRFGKPDVKKIAKWRNKITKVIGQSKENARVEFDEFGFDYVCIDEAHNCKKIFTSVVNDDENSEEKKSRYKLQTGEASTRGLKAFCITHFIQKNNNNKNVCLLTATPFTNSPLEIYSMLSLTNHKLIEDFGFKGLKEFFDYYIKTAFDFTINAKNQPVKKEEVVGFVNLQSLRTLIYSVIDYKTGEEANVIRPCKITLPIKDTSVICKETAQTVELPMIETIVKPTEQQMKFLVAIEDYMLGEKQGEQGIDFDNTEVIEDGDVAEDETQVNDGEDSSSVVDDGIVITGSTKSTTDESAYIEKTEGNIIYLKKIMPKLIEAEKNKMALTGERGYIGAFESLAQSNPDKTYYVIKTKKGYKAWQLLDTPFAEPDQASETEVETAEKESEFVRIMKGLSFMRSLTLSPYMFKKSGLGIPTAKEFVETSPKVKYTMECIREIKEHQEALDMPMPGIIIYCNLGTNKSSFGFSALELMQEYLTSKDGLAFKESEVALIYSKVSKGQREIIKKDFNDNRIKVIIGSATIKEGIDLQKNTAGLFNLTVDWNPTDAKQIEGRAWRQGNNNAYVFMNYVLLADSSDLVYFQKLQDKTSRIKEIWDKEGVKSQMDLKDFDPQQIKADLMTRADKIAIIEQDIEMMKIKRDNSIIMAKVEEMNKAASNIQNYLDSKDYVVEQLGILESVVVDYRRAIRIDSRQDKINQLKAQFSEIEFNDDLSEKEKEDEKKKIKTELSKISGKEFIDETNQMFKVENDYTSMTDAEIADVLKKEIDKFRYNGTYYKYQDYGQKLTESTTAIVEKLRYLYSVFNPEKTSSLAYKYLYSWKMAAYYQDKYLKSLGLNLTQVDEYRNNLIADSNSLEEQIANIKDKFPQRVEEIKDRIRRKVEKYKTISGRVDEFKSLFVLLNIPSGYGIAKKEGIAIDVERVSESEFKQSDEWVSLKDLAEMMLMDSKGQEKQEWTELIELSELMINS